MAKKHPNPNVEERAVMVDMIYGELVGAAFRDYPLCFVDAGWPDWWLEGVPCPPEEQDRMLRMILAEHYDEWMAAHK